jgi:hypothetical protein
MDSQTYKVTITNNWNNADHLGFPGSAHFSPVVSASHNTGYELFPLGGTATPGFEKVAEVGQAGDLENEIRRARSAGNVFKKNVTSNHFINPSHRNFKESASFTIEVSKDHPFLSFVSMVTPSPDWVIGVSNLELYSAETGFADGITDFELFAYDAGTENGDTAGNFSINNRPTNPQGDIVMLNGRGFDEPFATVTIEKM